MPLDIVDSWKELTVNSIVRRADVEKELRHHAPAIDADTFTLLSEMYSSLELQGTDSDEAHVLDGITKNGISENTVTQISIAQGAQLNKIIRNSDIRNSFEIGFAHGFSTIWILDALASRPDSFHRAVDPFEKRYWSGIGLKQVEKLNATSRFAWLEEHSIQALANSIKHGEMYDFIFIDGNHRFDDALVDFYLADKVLNVGGLIVLDDMWMPSIRSVASYVQSNRQFELIEQPVANMAVLKKTAPDDRDWRHFEPFEIHFDRPWIRPIAELACTLGQIGGSRTLSALGNRLFLFAGARS